MIFGLFSRKPHQSLERAESLPPSLPDNGQGTTSPSLSHQALPSPSPSPSPLTPQVTDPSALYSLIRSVPSQIFHTHSLDRLGSQNPEPPSPTTLTALTSFFSTLVPPPKMHCVRCHKSYFEVENTDRSCLVPHDDDSAEVERVSLSKAKGLGFASDYETHWGCCDRTVEGDGDMGPPDGWCYEGKHTTDVRRARFRADSTPFHDKLTPCSRLRCPGTLLSPTPSSIPSHTTRIAPKRVRPEDETDVEKERSPKRRRTRSTSSHRKIGEGVATTSKTETKEKEEEQKMDVDVQAPRPRRRKPRTSTLTDGNESSASAPPSTRPRLRARPRGQKLSSSTSEKPNSTISSSPLAKTETRSKSIKPRSSNNSLKGRKPASSVQSLSELSSMKSLSPSGMRIVQRVAYVEIPARPIAKTALSQETIVGTDKEDDDQCPRAQAQTQSRIPLQGPVSRARTKALAEIVDTSVDAGRAT